MTVTVQIYEFFAKYHTRKYLIFSKLPPPENIFKLWHTIQFFTIFALQITLMNTEFNSYRDSEVVAYWIDLCHREGELLHYERGDYFFREGEVARYLGYIQSGTLKYITFGDDGTEHVMGLEFTGGFVTDFPFSLHGLKARTSVVAASPCDILCVPTADIRQRIADDGNMNQIMAASTEAVFGMVYDRYKALYSRTPQQRYNDLIARHPDIFSLFPLRDIASFLKITPTHLSRLRKNI